MFSVHVPIHKITRKYWGNYLGLCWNSAHLKTRGSEKPQKLCLVRSPQKTNQNQKTKGFLLAVNYYCAYDRKRTSNRSAMSVFFYTYGHGLALAAVGIAFNKAPEK